MNTADLPFLSAADLGRLIAQKEVSPVEVAEAYLGRIEDIGFQFNAYLTVCRTEALEAAHEAERARAQAQTMPPGKDRDALTERARQAETAAQLSEWLRSPRSKSP